MSIEKKWTDAIQRQAPNYVLHCDYTGRWYAGKNANDINNALYEHRVYYSSPVMELLFPLDGVGGAQNKLVNTPIGPIKCYYYEQSVGLGEEGPPLGDFVNFIGSDGKPDRLQAKDFFEKIKNKQVQSQVQSRL